jgi:hypothetical protein
MMRQLGIFRLSRAIAARLVKQPVIDQQLPLEDISRMYIQIVKASEKSQWHGATVQQLLCPEGRRNLLGFKQSPVTQIMNPQHGS